MTDMPMNPIKNFPSGVMALGGDNAWEQAIDAVTYPVYIRPLYFTHPESADPENPDMERAEGTTNTGRDCQYFAIVVDRNRTGTLSTISTVTGLYDTLPVADVYSALQSDLEKANIKASPIEVYVSGDGGRQALDVGIEGLDFVDSNRKNKFEMHLVLSTSVNGSKQHCVRVAVVNAETGVEVIGVTGDISINLSARHTKTIKERHAAFSTILDTLLKEWNSTIIPSMMMFCDCTFDREFAVNILTEIMDDSDIPEKHRERALDWYAKTETDHSLYSVMHGLSGYLQNELENKQERLEMFREKITKKSNKVLQRTLKNMQKT